jgi:beta-glucosidase
MKMKILPIVAPLAFLFMAGCGSRNACEYPFRNPQLSVEERAADLVSRLTPEEKVAQMLNNTPAVERLGIPPYNWNNEALHGAGVGCVEHRATVYPQAIAIAAGWDTASVRKMADYIAEEGRAIYNMSQAKGNYREYRGLTFWSPNINIFRDPRWGRGQETYGEDPFLAGCMGKNYVAGLQGGGKYLKAAACAKHFAVHSGPERLRHSINPSVSDYELWDTYLPAFRALVVEAGVAGVMCAYSAFEGQPCCGSDRLLTDILRNRWKFTGYTVSDCWAIPNFYNRHKTHAGAADAAIDALIHGTDLECGNEAYLSLKKSLEEGKVAEAQLDVSLRRLFAIRLRLGMFDPKEMVPFSGIDSSSLNAPAHKQHTLRMARQGIVLLKNDGILPLKREELKKIAVVGPNAADPRTQLGNYNGTPPRSVTLLEALREKLPATEIVHEFGCGHTAPESLEELNLADHLASPEGFTVEFFNNTELQGEPAYKGAYRTLALEAGDQDYEEPIAPGVNKTYFSSRSEATFISPVTGTVEFVLDTDDGHSFYIDGEMLRSQRGRTHDLVHCRREMQRGRKYRLKLEHIQRAGEAKISIKAYVVARVTPREAAARVADADAIIFAGGIAPWLEGEEKNLEMPGFLGGDRTSIALPPVQTALLKELKATGKPVILVTLAGSALATPWESASLNAIVNAWYGGEFGGTAIADVLLGDYNPSGRLPVTFYIDDADLPDFLDYGMSNRTYRYFRGNTLYPFGYGLSYTSFAHEWASAPQKSYKTDGTLECEVNVTNTGTREGVAVTQIYIRYPEGEGFPLRELRAFDRNSLKADETRRVKISIPLEKLAKWDPSEGKMTVPTGSYSIFAGNHSDDEAAKAEFEITGN